MEIAVTVIAALVILAALVAWGWFCYRSPITALLLTLFMD